MLLSEEKLLGRVREVQCRKISFHENVNEQALASFLVNVNSIDDNRFFPFMVLARLLQKRLKTSPHYNDMNLLTNSKGSCCPQKINIFLIYFCVEGSGDAFLEELFSHGDFRSFSSKATPKSTTPLPANIDEEVSVDSGQASGVYSCPQDGCVRVFQRMSALEKHLSLEKCTKSLERHSLMDLAKLGYKSRLEEGVGALPVVLKAPVHHQVAPAISPEGWALRAAKKAYRFSEQQKSYLLAKFRIGQTTGRKLDAEVVAREMRRARGTDGVRLFQSSEFLTASQVASFFSRQSAAVRQRDPGELDVQASQEETNFSQAKEAVTNIQLQHPLVYDQYDLCAMALDDTLKLLKLPMLQRVCEDLGLDVPMKPVRKKAPYLALLKDITCKCTCRK